MKFDDGPIEELRCIVPSESDNRTMYFEDDWSFYAKLRRAKTLIIEAPFFREGLRQMTFSVAGLRWS